MKKIIILGGKGLIGSSLTKFLSTKGCEVLSIDIDNLDISDLYKTKSFFEKNKADVLINLFGKNEHVKQTNDFNTVDKIEESEIEEYFQINTLYTFRVCREFIKNNESGKILNFSSMYGHHVPNPKYYSGNHKSIGYCISKAGSVMITKYLAVHFPKFDIIDVVLGGIKNNQNKNFINQYIKDVPKGKLLELNDLNHTIYTLLETRYITGTSIFIDGGKNLM
jgi:NAD(P)-dependent dehydrogenase (short-subunit alcohol dehydrogenase family)